MQKVRVRLERRSYDIMIGHGLIINSGPIIAPFLSQSRVVVITDQNVAQLHLRSYEASMRSAGVSVSSSARIPVQQGFAMDLGKLATGAPLERCIVETPSPKPKAKTNARPKHRPLSEVEKNL